ncbi:unnamed protein product [Musa acuminata subsp. malaccensis]|uniref:(wild Malaysian banana) hypothetical protein n=1 Tax=Musa acuminata subsp. malaccensis TaxID=214687 RepID=A0A804K152_MUSAM|nr:unnamed protein product [Musa acuminata subsp. malaccensis]
MASLQLQIRVGPASCRYSCRADPESSDDLGHRWFTPTFILVTCVAYALLGAASFLRGPMRMTVSLCVIMVEITNNLKLLPLIMLVLLISKQYLRNRAAKEACKNQKVSATTKIDIISVLWSNKHNGFPVIDHEQNGEALVIGLILCSHLLVLVKFKMDFQNSPFPCDMWGVSNRYNFSDFVKTVSGKGMSTEDIHLTEDELELYLDLASYLNPAPYIVPEDMSLAKVYNLFRQKDLLIEESDHSATMELSSTSVRAQHLDRRTIGGHTHPEHPLLDSLLIQE